MKRQIKYAETLEIAYYSPEVRQMMEQTETCLNCGKRLNYLQRKEARRNRGYCCLACYYAKTPKMAWAEKVWGKPIKELIIGFLNEGKTGQASANLLGIEKTIFYVWLKKLRIKKKTIWY